MLRSCASTHRYTHFQLLESDCYPIRPGWLAHLALLAPRGKAWVRGSLSQCLRPTEQAHVNGNALYVLSPRFVREMRDELLKRLDSCRPVLNGTPRTEPPRGEFLPA